VRVAAPIRTGSVAAAIATYLNSSEFLHLAPTTRGDQRRILENLAKTERGTFPFAQMEIQDVDQLLAEKRATPHAAKSLLKALRSVAKVAVKLAIISEDPTKGIKVPTGSSEFGFRMWAEEEIAQFEARWPIGTRERLHSPFYCIPGSDAATWFAWVASTSRTAK
jgi:site-specific recombinase XerC